VTAEQLSFISYVVAASQEMVEEEWYYPRVVRLSKGSMVRGGGRTPASTSTAPPSSFKADLKNNCSEFFSSCRVRRL